MEFFWDEFPSFVVLSSLAYMEPIEKIKANIKAYRKYKSKHKGKSKCKSINKYKNTNKVRSKCKNQNKIGLSPNKRQVLRLKLDLIPSSD